MAPDCSAPSSSLPPLPLPPYSPDTLISYVSTFTLPDPDDGSTGPTSSSTVVDRCKVRAWNYGSIRFSRDDGMLDDLESRLRWLRVGAPSPAPRLGLAPSRSPWIESEPDVRAHLEAMGQKVNSIISDSRELLQPHLKWSNGHPQWRDQLHASARPDFRLTTRTFSPPGFVNRPRLIEAKKLVHLRSIVKLMANKAGQGDGFRLIVRENGKTDLEERSWGDVGPDDKERVRKVLTQVSRSFLPDLSLPSYCAPDPSIGGAHQIRRLTPVLPGRQRDDHQRRILKPHHRFSPLPSHTSLHR